MKLSEKVIKKFKENIFDASPDGCHYFTGSVAPNGYGRVHEGHRGTFYAHRISYQLHKGDPGDLFVCHTCDNRMCVNPHHLFLGTPDDNVQDKLRKGRHRVALRSDLTRYDVEEIRQLYNEGKNQYEIAEMYGCRQPAVSRIVNLKRRATQ